MPLAPGTRIGVYEVAAALGAGGTGEVYRARDTSLGRDVAIKILPETFATDPDRLARFEREARSLAQLNHPNIAQAHGFDDVAGHRALVMELVSGEELSARIAKDRFRSTTPDRLPDRLPTRSRPRTVPASSIEI